MHTPLHHKTVICGCMSSLASVACPAAGCQLQLDYSMHAPNVYIMQLRVAAIPLYSAVRMLQSWRHDIEHAMHCMYAV